MKRLHAPGDSLSENSKTSRCAGGVMSVGRGSACGKPIPFEAGRAFGTCAFDSRPLLQVWVCWGDW
jgi:hypothetical protein